MASPHVRFLLMMTAVYAVAFVGAQGSMVGLPEWYAALKQPSWTPPNWLFGPVWTVLYAGMGVAAYLIWQSDSQGKKLALNLFFVQLFMNGLWSWLFFAWHLVGVAAAEIGLLWILIAATIATFARADRRAAWLLVPYLGWVGFATILNVTIWALNR